MTAREVKHEAIARQTVQEPAAQRLLPDYERMVQLLADFDTIGTQVASTDSGGYTDARDQAEDLAVAVAMRVVKGLRNVQLPRYCSELAKAAGYQKSERDGLRDENLVNALEAVVAAATPVATELAQERVPAALQDLNWKTNVYRPLVGTPRGQTSVGSTLRTTVRKLVGQLRAVFGRLDTRLDSLGKEDEFRPVVAKYRQTRRLGAGGHGAHDAGKPAAGK